MDYTSIPRSLFYKEKTNLSVFTRKPTKDSLEYQFFKKLKQMPFVRNSVDAPNYVQEILNNACYICGMIYREEQASLYFARYKNKATTECEGLFTGQFIQLSTMALVYNWLNTEWFRNMKNDLDSGAEIVDEIKQEIYQYYDDKSLLSDKWIRDSFLDLVLDADMYHPYMDLQDVSCRPLEEAIKDPNVPIEDVVEGIDYICNEYKGLEETEPTILLMTLDRLEHEADECENLSSFQKDHALNTVKSRLRELGYLPKKATKGTTTPIVDKSVHNYHISNTNEAEIEQLRKERDEWKKKYEEALEQEPKKAFNVQTENPCFTNKQMGLLMYAVGCLTEKPSPGKTTIGKVVERISGYSAKTAGQNNKGSFSEKDKKIVAEAIESKFPKLAAKVRTL